MSSNNYYYLELLDKPTNPKLDSIISKKPIKTPFEAEKIIHDAIFELDIASRHLEEFDVFSKEPLERVIIYLQTIKHQQYLYMTLRGIGRWLLAAFRLFIILAMVVALLVSLLLLVGVVRL